MREWLSLVNSLDKMTIAGIPADWLAHFFAGAMIFYFFQQARFRNITVFFIVLMVGIEKEIMDWSLMTGFWDIHESANDVLITLLGGLALAFPRKSPPQEIVTVESSPTPASQERAEQIFKLLGN